jgi:T5SS/PEP-CTERM-associated repeat protein
VIALRVTPAHAQDINIETSGVLNNGCPSSCSPSSLIGTPYSLTETIDLSKLTYIGSAGGVGALFSIPNDPSAAAGVLTVAGQTPISFSSSLGGSLQIFPNNFGSGLYNIETSVAVPFGNGDIAFGVGLNSASAGATYGTNFPQNVVSQPGDTAGLIVEGTTFRSGAIVSTPIPYFGGPALSGSGNVFSFNSPALNITTNQSASPCINTVSCGFPGSIVFGAADLNVGNVAIGTGLGNGSLNIVGSTLTASSLTVGQFSSGSASVQSTGALNAGSLTLGEIAPGQLQVCGSANITGVTSVGGSSPGVLTISNGGTVSTEGLNISTSFGTGTVSVTGAGSNLTSSQALSVGHASASLSITDGASVNVVTGAGTTLVPGGAISVDGSGSTFSAGNTLSFQQGPGPSPILNVTNGGTVVVGSPSDLPSGGGLVLGSTSTLAFNNVGFGQSGADIITTGALQLGGTIQIQSNGLSAGTRFVPLIESSTLNLSNGATTLSLGARSTDPTTGDYIYPIMNLQGGTTASFLIPHNILLVPVVTQQIIHGTAVDIVGLGTVPPPSLLDLAKMSKQAYNVVSLPAPIDGYTSKQSDLGPGGFFAQVFQNGNQVVVSFRGTDAGNLYNAVKDLLADSSFLSGEALFTASGVDPDLLTQLRDAAGLLAQVRTTYPDAEITLTGHSLGGAIAQILGAYTGLPTQAFDAPGAGDLITLSTVQDALSPLNNTRFENTGSNNNLRMYGDQISLVGTGIGTQQTIATTSLLNDYLNNPPIIPGEIPIPLTPTDIAVARTFLQSHDIGFMVSQLSASAAIEQGVTGPKATVPIALAAEAGVIARYVGKQVFGKVDTELDPPIGQSFTFTEDVGSPDLYAVTLPALFGVGEWKLQEWLAGQWAPDQLLAPLQPYFFDPGAMEFQFWALDQNNDVLTLPSGFVFDLRFATDGTFSGTVEANTAEVPEPNSFLLTTTSILLLLFMTIYNRRVG